MHEVVHKTIEDEQQKHTQNREGIQTETIHSQTHQELTRTNKCRLRYCPVGVM